MFMPISPTDYSVGKQLRPYNSRIPDFLYEISYLAYPSYYKMPAAHQHGGVEIILGISGFTLLESGVDRYLILPGAITVVPGHVTHRVRVLAPPYRRWLLHVNSEFFRDAAQAEIPSGPVQIRLPIEIKAQLLSSLSRCLWNLRAAQAFREERMRLKRLLAYLGRELQLGNRPRILSDGDIKGFELVIAPVLQAIHKSAVNVDLQSLAEVVNFSYSHLRRRFNQLTGMSLSDYVRIQRIERAQRLLVRDRGRVSVRKVARFLRFSDTAHFSHYFKEQTGLSPTEYRQRVIESV